MSTEEKDVIFDFIYLFILAVYNSACDEPEPVDLLSSDAQCLCTHAFYGLK